MLIGAHVSIAGGISLAPGRGAEIGCTAIQIFLKNQRQWQAKDYTDDEVKSYFRSLSNSPIKTVLAHSSYLVLPKNKILKKGLTSLNNFVII